MININEINEEIKKLEQCDCTTYKICEKLAILYIVRDHYKGGGNGTSTTAPTTMTMP